MKSWDSTEFVFHLQDAKLHLQDSTILDVVNYIHMEEAYGQFRNHIQKYSLTNGQPLKLARKRLKLTIKIEDFAVYPRYQMTE